MPSPLNRMRAIILDHAAPNGITIRDVDVPRPGTHEALVRVAAVSLERYEIAQALAFRPDGSRLGSDLAGVIEAPSPDGSGPAVGSRVAGLVRSGAWAQFVAVPSDALVELPAKVSFSAAAALPVSGLTALHGLGYGGLLVAKRVLIAGGIGGVGLCAIQLAHLSGAVVTATVPDRNHEALMDEYGADHVIAGEVSGACPFGPYDLVMAAAGTSRLDCTIGLLREDGTCVLYGKGEGDPVRIDEYAFVERRAHVHGIALFEAARREPAADGLQRLLALVAAKALRPHVEFEARWEEVGVASRQVFDRDFAGKAVLHL